VIVILRENEEQDGVHIRVTYHADTIVKLLPEGKVKVYKSLTHDIYDLEAKLNEFITMKQLVDIIQSE